MDFQDFPCIETGWWDFFQVLLGFLSVGITQPSPPAPDHFSPALQHIGAVDSAEQVTDFMTGLPWEGNRVGQILIGLNK